jgi:peptidyl-prolyl cis-trans isomerase B (cyclophilin B)
MPSDKQRREAARRRVERQRSRKRADERSSRRVAVLLSIVGIVVLAVVVGIVVATTSGDKSTPSSAGSSAASSAAASKAPGTCTWSPGPPAARKVTPPATTVPTSGLVTLAVKTNRGDMTFRLNRDKAPCTVASFTSLVTQKYFDNTSCHRLTTAGIFVLQCGDPTGTGTGGPGYTVPDEYVGSELYKTGVLAMANTGAPNSGGSQFFIVYRTTQLPPTYTIFGTVSTGMPVVDAVAAAGSDNAFGQGDGHPKLAINLTKVTVP